MEYEIKSGPMPDSSRVTKLKKPLYDAVRRLLPGQWLAVPKDDVDTKPKRYRVQTGAVNAGRQAGFQVKTKTAVDGSLIIFRPERQ